MRWFAALMVMAIMVIVPGAGAYAQRVVLANSDPLVVIHSTFTGRTITMFGNVEPDGDQVSQTGSYDVIVTLQGPTSNRIVRSKERQFGMVLNGDAATYRVLPGYYAVMSSRPLDILIGAERAMEPRFSLLSLAASARMEPDREVFDAELVRLMQNAGRFTASARGVSFHSPTTFSTRLFLPSNAPNGVYTAEAFVVSDGAIVSSTTTSFIVRTEGFERFVARSAQTNSLLYGIIAVLIAIATGWIGGVLFKR